MTKLAVIAVGGNSLIKDDKNVTVEDQMVALQETAHHIADMIEAGWDLAIGHGNGPQVGFILRRSEIAAKAEGMHEVPLDVCGADSQGAIGYEFQQALQNEYHRRGIKKGAATVITQMLVDQKDRRLPEADQTDRLVHGRGRGAAPCQGYGLVCRRGCRQRLEKSRPVSHAE